MSKKLFRRFDLTKLDKAEITPQGFLRIPVFAARTGVQVYRTNDGTIVREFRPPEEVFSEQTMGSLRSIPITNDHPKQMVSLDNAKELVIGYTSDTIQNIDNKYLKTEAIIMDKKTIEDIQSGKIEVSMGYEVELDETPGEFEGQKFDMVQRNIVHNHLAIVDRGRAGPNVSLKLDSGDAMEIEENHKGDSMPKIKVGDKEFEVAADLAEAFKSMKENFKKEMDEMKKSKKDEAEETKAVEEAKAETAEVKAEAEKLEAKVDSLTKELEKAPKVEAKLDASEVRKLVRERAALEKVAVKVLSKESFEKVDSLDDLELKKEIIKTESPEVKLDEKSEVYIEARYDYIAETVGKSDKANKKVSKALEENKEIKEDIFVTSEEARQKFLESQKDLWKTPVGKIASNK
jgi:hypothetical protein